MSVTQLPLNGLAKSSDILREQENLLSGGAYADIDAEPVKARLTASDLDVTPFGASPQGIPSFERTAYSQYLERPALNEDGSYAGKDDVLRPVASQGVDKARLNGKNAATDDERRIYYDGPAKNAKGVSDIVTEVGGLSLSPGQLLKDAEDALLGIIHDLTRMYEDNLSLHDILVKNNRLRGLGSLLVVVAVVGLLLKLLVKT
jgi:hypothetical protein